MTKSDSATGPVTPQDRFAKFEADADRQVAALAIWRFPLRSVLSNLYLSVDSLFTGGRFTRQNAPKPGEGGALLSYMSYLARFFRHGTLQIGSDIDDALSVFQRRHIPQFKAAIVYGHFSQLMPEVWRQYYGVELVPKGFRLRHPGAAFAEIEERDIVLTELTLPFDTHPRAYPREAFDRAIERWPHLDGRDIYDILFGGLDHYTQAMREHALLPDEAYEDGLGFHRDDFHRVRAALIAIADFCLGMADAAERRYHIGGRFDRDRYARECREWIAPVLSENFVLGTIQGLTQIPFDTIDAVLQPLIIDATRGDFENAGEGYLPPLVRFEGSFLASPHAVKLMLPERNLLYVLNKRNRPRFDRLVSRHLEPALLAQAHTILTELPGVLVERNVKWQRGEIDLLAFQPLTNVVVHMQAKAALPPQGARMTQQVETHTLRAVEQLARLETESDAFRDELCTKVFRQPVAGATWVSAILSRSSLGTWRAWSGLRHYVPLNIPLLRETVRRISAAPDQSLMAVPAIATGLLSEFVRRTVRGWDHKRLKLFGVRIDAPLLDLDNDELPGPPRGCMERRIG